MPRAFERFALARVQADPRVTRLCLEAARPDESADTTRIHCRIEGETFAYADPMPARAVTIAAWNIEQGLHLDGQLQALSTGTAMPTPDILLLSEADRGCQRTGYRHVARDIAERLRDEYVFVTEFVELSPSRHAGAPGDPPPCEHGNAIVSRFPLGNVRQLRFANQVSWYEPPGTPNASEPRLGGRVALAADVRVGTALLRVYALHLESRDPASVRGAQADEVASDAAHVAGPIVIAGDFNAYYYASDILHGTSVDEAARVFRAARFSDAHEGLPLEDRYTADIGSPKVLDIMYVKGLKPIARGVCNTAACDALSDHAPIWATIAWPPR